MQIPQIGFIVILMWPQFVKYCMVGVVNTCIDLIIYFALTRYVGFAGGFIFVAKGISFYIATLNSYFLNRTWTFGRQDNHTLKELVGFYLVVGSGIFINTGVHFVNVYFLHMNDLISAGIAALGTAVWGFTLARSYIFK